MHLKDYFPQCDAQRREKMAEAAKVSVGHLRNVVYGAPVSPAVIARLERFTKGQVTRIAHFPETYTDLWPELGRKRKPALSQTQRVQMESMRTE